MAKITCILPAVSAVLTVVLGVNTCNVSYIKLTGMAILTCNFSENLYQTRSNFSVHRFTQTNKMKDLLVCFWRDSRPYCTKEINVTLFQEITNNITVVIPSWIMEESALFFCNVGNSPKHDKEPCTVNNVKPAILSSPSHAPVIPDTSVVRDNSFTVKPTTTFLISATDNSRTDKKLSGVTSTRSQHGNVS